MVKKCVVAHISMVRLLYIFHPLWTYKLVVQFIEAHPNELDISSNMHEQNIFEDLSNLTVLKPLMYHTLMKFMKRVTLIATLGNFRFQFFFSGIRHRQKYEYRYTVLNLVNNMCIVYFLKWSPDWNINRSTNTLYYSITISSNSKSKMSHFFSR